MAHIAVYLRSRTRLFLRASAPLHSASCRSYFSSSSSSSSSSSDSSDETPQNMENNQTNVKHSFNDVISHLKGSDRQPSQQPPRPGSIFSQGISIEEIRKNLSSFTRCSADSSGPSGFQDSQGQSPILFQNLYKKMTGNSSQSGGKDTTQKSAFDSIRKHMQNRTPATGGSQGPSTMSVTKLKESLNLKQEESSIKDPMQNRTPATGGSQGPSTMSVTKLKESLNLKQEEMQHPVFLNELSEKPKKVADANELLKSYKKDELGEKLRKLRPEGAKQGQNSFSLSELNERLIKLRELEQQQSKTLLFQNLRRALKEVNLSGAESENRIQSTSEAGDGGFGVICCFCDRQRKIRCLNLETFAYNEGCACGICTDTDI
ncbi:hypothetical protein V2J09_023409 [Rumex salicifolius]